MLAQLLGLEKRSTTGPSFSAGDYEQLVLSGQMEPWNGGGSAYEALAVPPMWQGVLLLSGDLAKLPLEKIKLDSDGRETRDPTHRTWSIVHDEPTPTMGAFKWWRRFYVQLVLFSNAYARINRNASGEVDSLTLWESSGVSHAMRQDGEWGYWYLNDGMQFEFVLASNVLHVEDLSLHAVGTMDSSRHTPISMLDRSRLTIRSSLMIERYGTKFFEHGGRFGGWLELPATMTKPARDNYEKQFRDVYENPEAQFKTVVSRGGVKFHSDQADPEKTQLIEAKKEQRREVANYLGLPAYLLGDDTRTAYNTLEQERKGYHQSTLAPRLIAVQDECKIKLLTAPERKTGKHFYKHDVSSLLEVDAATAMANASAGYSSQLLTQNEGRRRIGEQPVEGGDEFLSTPLGGVPEREAEDSPPDAPPPEPEPEEDQLRFVRIPLLDAVKHTLEYLEGRAVRKRRELNERGYDSWLAKMDEHVRARVAGRIGAAVKAYAGSAGIDENTLFDRILHALCHEIRNKRDKLQHESASLLLLERIESTGASNGNNRIS